MLQWMVAAPEEGYRQEEDKEEEEDDNSKDNSTMSDFETNDNAADGDDDAKQLISPTSINATTACKQQQ